VYTKCNLALLLWRRQDAPGAIRIFCDATAADPWCAYAHKQLGFHLLQVRDAKGAMIALRRAIAVDPRSPSVKRDERDMRMDDDADLQSQAQFFLGDALQHLGDPKGAVAAYKASIEDNPKFIDAHMRIADVLQTTFSDLAGASRCLVTALKLNPDNQQLKKALANVLALMRKERKD